MVLPIYCCLPVTWTPVLHRYRRDCWRHHHRYHYHRRHVLLAAVGLSGSSSSVRHARSSAHTRPRSRTNSRRKRAA
uniref:Uncharacterized protein n=1 Tax=Anopheles dirus TaxID=7168 RepID=A0A182NYB8_9DIPT